MKILIVMDPGILVPPKGYGGHERLVEIFANEYHRKGHEVHLLVTDGSEVPGCVVHPFGKEGFPPKKSDASRAIPRAWKFLWKHRNDFDLIHNFGRLAYLLPVLHHSIRKIMTYGREIDSKNISLINNLHGRNIVFTACSSNLLSRVKAKGIWEVVYNAIDFSKYELTENLPQDAPLFFLGRIEKVKGCHTAIKLAKITGNKLIIAGNISPLPDEKLYFENEIRPHIDGVQIQYIGAVNDEQKNEYIGRSKALIFPIEWNEPFGIVMIEAMACGTPVIGFKTGSVPEVIDEGITGHVVSNLQQMIESVKRVEMIDRNKCRSMAEFRFDVRKIALRYLNLFNPENKVVIITSGQPSANPRVVKEATALSNFGFDVTVIYCPMSPWANDFDKLLFARTPQIKWINAGYDARKNPWKYNLSRVRRKCFELLNNYSSLLFKTDIKGMFLFAPELKKKAKLFPGSIYIAHSVAALPAAVVASKKWEVPYAFDAEDFHRGESKKNGHHWNHTAFIESKYLANAAYLSAASPLIKNEYQKYFPALNTVTINNVFPITLLAKDVSETNGSEELKLFWFSQKIGRKRGLIDIIKAIGEVNNKRVKLTLLGNLSGEDKKYVLLLMMKHKVTNEQVKFHEPVKEDEIPIISSQHHIGLALEPGRDLNNKIALSNKLFIYLLSGNAVLFSSTTAQKDFFEENKGIGGIYEPGDYMALANLIKIYLENPNLLKEHRNKSHELAKTKYNWEIESVKLLSIVKKAIEKKQ